jgi:hypothetical protein
MVRPAATTAAVPAATTTERDLLASVQDHLERRHDGREGREKMTDAQPTAQSAAHPSRYRRAARDL